MEHKTPAEVEKELRALLEKHELEKKLSVSKIKGWILNERSDNNSAMNASNVFQKKCMQYFPHVGSEEEYFSILQMMIDAWNYFPHKTLGGKSPWQVTQTMLKNHPEYRKKPGKQKMPDVIVGGHKMKWEEYETMLKEMERVQRPFKNWIENDVLPNYKKYLQSVMQDKTLTERMRTAEIFFDRVLQIGFVNFNHIRPAFIQSEFPRWWQTHVFTSSLSEKETLSSLSKLFNFIGFRYRIDISRFGF